MSSITNFPGLLQKYFAEHLKSQKKVSQNTIESYRDTCRILFEYMKNTKNIKPSKLTLDDLNVSTIGDFLAYIENQRGASIKTRNQRLACIKSFFNYISIYAVEYIQSIQKVLAIPKKKAVQEIVDYLTLDELEALLSIPNLDNWIGNRDYTLMMFIAQTGLRVSEATNLTLKDITEEKNKMYVHCIGKGRKEREVPLTKEMSKNIKNWIKIRGEKDSDILFVSNRGKGMSVDAVQFLIKKYAALAKKKYPALKGKKVSPHVLRHTTAMMLLQAGVDRSLIALWLGHEKVETTQIYLKADLSMKEEILKKYVPLENGKDIRFKADDELLTFLNSI